MHDCADDLRAYHHAEVTLPDSERGAMRDRRDTNRSRLRKGLSDAGKPAPIEFVSQGSYAMRTMISSPECDYDVDDGVYFWKSDLLGERGAEMTTLQARQMVRDCVDHGRFKRAPEVRPNCVRVYYDAGYHVDLPVYRCVTDSGSTGEGLFNELAASSGWRRSDARDVTAWYESERSRSPDGTQLRRVNRMLKKHARSRPSWRGAIVSGFGISVLTVELFRANPREDKSLYETIVAIRDRLRWNLEVRHPVTPGETITNDANDSRASLLLSKLTEVVDILEPLFAVDCTRERALKCWDRVFSTTFFSNRLEDERRAALGAPAIISAATLISATSGAAAAVSSAGGGRHA